MTLEITPFDIEFSNQMFSIVHLSLIRDVALCVYEWNNRLG